LDKVGDVHLRVGGVDISPLNHVRDMGVMLDSLLTMKQQADTVARSCFYQMRQLRSVRRSLTFNALHTLVHALSKVDYCNAVLYGAPAYAVRRLQAVLNGSTGTRLNEHITPVLRDTLHWLHITQHIMVALCNRADHYIFTLLFLYSSIYLSIFFFYSSPNLSGHRLDVYHTFDTWCCPIVRI